MDELTLRYLRRALVLRRRALLGFLAAAFGFGWVTPSPALADVTAVFAALGAWSVLAWAADDLQSGALRAALAASHARRSWLAAHLFAAPLIAAAACFCALLSQGIRPAFTGALIVLPYGWAFAVLGMTLFLLADRPSGVVWWGGAALALVAWSASSEGVGSSGVGRTLAPWHPMALFKFGLHRALHPVGSAGPSLVQAPYPGLILTFLVALLAWRWSLRVLDRLEDAGGFTGP